MAQFAPWEAATRCTSGPTPGARALMAHILRKTPDAHSLGIFNCRSVRGGSTTSLHGEGRALDVGMPMAGGRGSKAGHALVSKLRADAAALGIQAIIYDRTIWSAKSPGGRRYTGVAPHYDHLHVELTRAAGARLNLATIGHVLGGAASTGSTKGVKDVELHKMGSRTLERGSEGTDVAILQFVLGVDDDGGFGTGTEDAVKAFQKANKVTVDGVCGKQTHIAIAKKLQ